MIYQWATAEFIVLYDDLKQQFEIVPQKQGDQK